MRGTKDVITAMNDCVIKPIGLRLTLQNVLNEYNIKMAAYKCNLLARQQ